MSQKRRFCVGRARPVALVAGLVVLMAGCATVPEPETQTLKNPPVRAQLGAFGLETQYIAPSVRPGDDFFKHVNGGWLATATIPADRSTYGSFQILAETAEARLKVIIEKLAQQPQPRGVEQKVGQLYSSWMDEAAIEARGLEPARAGLARIDAVRTREDLARLFGAPGFMAPVNLYVDLDGKNPDRYLLNVSQGGLGLPEREYYLKASFAAARSAYKDYIVRVLTLAGASPRKAAADAKIILALETKLAQAHWPAAKRRERDLTYNLKTIAQLRAFAPNLDWDALFVGMGAVDVAEVNVAELSAVKAIANIVRTVPLDQWKVYQRFHYLSSNAAYLPAAFDKASFDFYGKALEGREQQRDRWKRGVSIIDGNLGEAVGRVYVERYFSGDSKEKMKALVSNVKAAMRNRIQGLEWMGAETKAAALVKLDSLGTKIGYPDKWRDYDGLEIRPGDLFGNMERTAQFNLAYDLARLSKPVDRQEWLMTPQTVNAYYWPSMNEIVFPAAILQPPFFDPNADPAVNYGGIGMVIGHEISHAFDDQGRKSDEKGLLRDWWTKSDSSAFEERAKKLVEQYDGYEPLPGHHINGRLTLGENIADLAGILVSYDAYKLSLGGAPAPVLNGLTGDQRFFMAQAQIWRTKMRDETLKKRLASGPHSPPEYRVNGLVPNVDAWYSAFGVEQGQGLFVKPEDRVRIW